MNTTQQKNQELKDKLEQYAPLRERGFNDLSKFRCVECDGIVSPATVKFNNYDVTKVVCYICQKRHEAEDGVKQKAAAEYQAQTLEAVFKSLLGNK